MKRILNVFILVLLFTLISCSKKDADPSANVSFPEDIQNLNELYGEELLSAEGYFFDNLTLGSCRFDIVSEEGKNLFLELLSE